MSDTLNHLMNIVITALFTNICIFYTYIRIINFKSGIFKTLIAIISSAIVAVVYTFMRNYLNVIVSTVSTYFIYNVILAILTRNKMDVSVIYTLIAFAIANIAYVVSILIAGPLLYLVYSNPEFSIYYIIYGIVQILLIYLFFKIRKFRNGFEFLQRNNAIKNIEAPVSMFIVIIMLVFDLFRIYLRDAVTGEKIFDYIVVELIIVGIIIAFWIWREFKSFHKENMKERYIKSQEDKIRELENDKEKLLKENEGFSSTIHKYRSGFVAMERTMQGFTKKANLSMNTEFAAEYGDILDNIKTMSKNFSNEALQSKIKDKKIEKTNIFKVDSILNYMLEESIKNNIKFDLKLSGSINLMIENVIAEEDLATLLGDHIKNAIIALNNSDNTNRSILVLLGIVEDYYEILIYDSGIEFEIETLINLGLKRVTTHKDDGGSGIGFMTSFEMLEKNNASLIIEEKEPSIADYTKIIKIRFDGKKEYRIVSYRSSEIKAKLKDERIIVE